jgi:CelD/BcsL family acetyltransferase involved in cellulose biosynthesis
MTAEGKTPTVRSEGPTSKGQYTVILAQSEAEVESMRPAWASFRWRRVDADLDFFLAVVGVRPEVVRPHVLLLERAGRPQVMLVARVEDIRLEARVGYSTVHRPRVRSITAVPGGVAGATTPEASDALISALLGSLQANLADVAIIPGVEVDSHLYSAADRAPFLRRGHQVPTTDHWKLDVPASMDDFMRSLSKNARGQVRSRANRLRREFGESLSFRVLSSPDDGDRLFEDVGAVAAKTYQHELGIAFEADEERRRLVELALERGLFRAYLLYVEEQPIAFWQGYVYDRTFFIGSPGYDPAFQDYRPGSSLLVNVIEQLCADEDIDVLDYGSMYADYKRRFGSGSWEEGDVFLYAPTVRGATVNAVRTAALSAHATGKRLVAGTDAGRKLKAGWRSRLAAMRAGNGSARN